MDFTGSGNSEFIVFGEFVHTQNSDDILEGLVVLEEFLNASGDSVVLLADDGGVEDTGGRIQRIHSRVDPQLGEGSGQHSGGIQESEGGGWSGIGQIVSRHIDGLYGRDGAFFGGGDSLLQGSQVSGEGGLIPDSRGDTAEEGRDFGAGLGEPEDVVDEEQDILAFLISEILGDGEASESHSGSGSWGLVHLPVDQGTP